MKAPNYSILVALMLFATGANHSSTFADDWPTFRGADRSGVSAETGLLRRWPKNGPKLLWETSGAGRGYAGVAISDGKLFTLGDAPSTENDKDEYVSCYSLEDGRQLWSKKTGPAWRAGAPSWQSSRSTPTVDGERVYVVTPRGKVICLATEDGQEYWRVDLKKQFGGTKAEVWGYSESVLIDGDQLVCTPGGPQNTMVALNKMTGKKIWSNGRKKDRGAGHSSVVISNVGGRKVYVQMTASGPMGVDAVDGEILWTWDIAETTAVIPTPIVRDDLVFIAVGYKRGGALLRQKAYRDTIKIEQVYGLNKRLSNKHGGVVLVGDYVYGDSDDGGIPFCAQMSTGRIMWKGRGSGKNSASIAAADGCLYIRYADGTMTLVKANPKAFKEVGGFKVPGSGKRPSWAHPVIAGGKLYLREGDSILCYEVSKKR